MINEIIGYSIVKNTKISSEFLAYTQNFSRTMNSDFKKVDPMLYLDLVMETMHIFRILEDELDSISLLNNEKNTLDLFKGYKKWNYLKPYDNNYIMFATLKSEKFGIEYLLLKPSELKKFENDFEIVYSAILPNKYAIKSLYRIFMKAANKLSTSKN
ncbi:hypothetical protein MmarC5_0066 [Methanococcus maripaludis C5]|uniref:Uncharacterized protein n=1 Tax=Methanococcus maripaludis (strain C5 / ATCC BAA-1333) TaxID=402880 RepID=A4FW12_METM5|nr:hypothetical protein [Methanococcus maripaludis]ABO34383.1 hypothetical protein MmarC5_0066 [Methanococcus maripaludis C5]